MRLSRMPGPCLLLSVCAVALMACADDEDDGSCPPLDELILPATYYGMADGTFNGLQTSNFIDRNRDGLYDFDDAVDYDMDGVPDDFNDDGSPDNIFLFNDQAARIPDADSFDDYEEPEAGILRATVPVPGSCPADGIATGPMDVSGLDGRPVFASWKPSRCCRRVPKPEL
jgi:hypothetical protein